MTHIYIPSRKRHYDVKTLQWMNEYWLERTTLFVHESEITHYLFNMKHRYPTVRVLPHNEIGIESIRRAIGLVAEREEMPYFFMLDDDFKLYQRASPESVSLLKQTKDDFGAMMRDWGLAHVDGVPVTGISFRSGNNNFGPCGPNGNESNTRLHGAMGFDTKLFNSIPRFGMPYMEDFAMILWCLTQGHKNRKLMYWCYDQAMTNAAGGCSLERTHEAQDRSARMLHELFPEFVTIVEKENKTGGAFGTRTDVRIAWQKAAKSGAARLARTPTA